MLCTEWSSGKCAQCQEGAVHLDLIFIKGYQQGEKILGDMETCGWVVLRGIHVTQNIYDKTMAICNNGRWFPISTEKNRLMRYNHNSKLPLKWNEPELLNFRNDIESICLSKLKVITTPLGIGKFNVLRNNNTIDDDQDPHFDYPPREVV